MPKIILKPLYQSRYSPQVCDLKSNFSQVHPLSGDLPSQDNWQTPTVMLKSCQDISGRSQYHEMLVDTTTQTIPPHLSTRLPPATHPSSWIDKFRDIYNNDKYLLKCWFWDNFNWNQNTIWIGKYHCIDQLPDSNEEIIKVMNRLMSNLDQYPHIKSQIYLKFYFSRNIETNQPEINYLMLCNHSQLPAEFLNTTINQSFEKYQLTKAILDLDQDFKKMVNHYLNWSNFYIYYSLMEELQY